VTELVVDSSVAMKWLVPEHGSDEALTIYRRHRLLAPELFLAECANVLWKKVARREIGAEEAQLAARILAFAEVELVSMRTLLEASVALAVTLGHPAYDCAYLALASARKCPFVTADARLLEAVARRGDADLAKRVVSLTAAASGAMP
jgi:predicted nucleic acid-binding protein